MKRSSVIRGIIAIIFILIIGVTAVGCGNTNNSDDNLADKTSLNAEIALAITEQGDYTADSYNTYAGKLAEAKEIANSASATQEAVDQIASDLSEARLALEIRPVEEVGAAVKTFSVASGDSREITLADYVNDNGLSKITYKIQASDEIVSLSPIDDGKFTITAGETSETADVTVSIIVCYDGNEKLEVELSLQITGKTTDSPSEYVPDDNVDTDW